MEVVYGDEIKQAIPEEMTFKLGSEDVEEPVMGKLFRQREFSEMQSLYSRNITMCSRNCQKD